MCYVQHLVGTKDCKKTKYPTGHGKNGRGNWIRQWYQEKGILDLLNTCPGRCGRAVTKLNPLCGCHVKTSLSNWRYIIPMCRWCNLNRNGEWIYIREGRKALMRLSECDCGYLENPAVYHKMVGVLKIICLLVVVGIVIKFLFFL